jgi:nucleoside 2-deoxyribosyltransferase
MAVNNKYMKKTSRRRKTQDLPEVIKRVYLLSDGKTSKPWVYFAGKMSSEMKLMTPDHPENFHHEGETFVRSGPFRIPVGITDINDNEHKFAYRQCIIQIKRADIIVASFNPKLDCFGTITEVGYAAGLGKPIYIIVPPEINTDENTSVKEIWFPIEGSRLSIESRIANGHQDAHIFENVPILKIMGWKCNSDYLKYIKSLPKKTILSAV